MRINLIQGWFQTHINFCYLSFFIENRLWDCVVDGIAIDFFGTAVSEGYRDGGSICDMINDRYLAIGEAQLSCTQCFMTGIALHIKIIQAIVLAQKLGLSKYKGVEVNATGWHRDA